MTIILLARSLDYGGAERQLVLLAKGLKARGHKVVVSVFYGGGHFEKELIQSGIDIKDLAKQGRWQILSFLFRFAGFLKSAKPRVVYGFLSLPNILAALFRKFVPQAKIVWGMRATNPEFSHYNWLVPWVYRLESLLAKHCDLVIVNSNAGRRDCEKRNFPRSKLLLIPNGVDTEYFSPNRAAGRAFRVEHGVLDNEKLIGIVGRLDPMKDHSTFLSAFALVNKEIEQVKALIIGEESEFHRDYVEALHEQIESLGITEIVIWVQSLGTMPPVYNAMDVLVSSSSFGEGFPNVVVEAMSCGIPCVVTQVGDAADIVGGLGEVVEPRSAKDLAQSIIKTLRNGGARTSPQQIREHIEKNFSLDKYVEATELAICSED